MKRALRFSIWIGVAACVLSVAVLIVHGEGGRLSPAGPCASCDAHHQRLADRLPTLKETQP